MHNRHYNVVKIGEGYYPQHRSHGAWETMWNRKWSTASAIFDWLLDEKFMGDWKQATSHISMPVESFVTGWLAPDGTHYACSDYEHGPKSSVLGYGYGHDALLNRGYVHVGEAGNTHSHSTPSQAQLDWLWDAFVTTVSSDQGLHEKIERYLNDNGVQTKWSGKDD